MAVRVFFQAWGNPACIMFFMYFIRQIGKKHYLCTIPKSGYCYEQDS